MIKVVLLMMIGWCAQALAMPSSNAQKVIELDQALTRLDLNRDMWFYEDSADISDRDDFMTPEFNAKFAPILKKTPNFGFSKSS